MTSLFGARVAFGVCAASSDGSAIAIDIGIHLMATCCARRGSQSTHRAASNCGHIHHALLARQMEISDWIHSLPVVWMAVVIFGVTYLAGAAVYATVTRLATDERARAFKGVSAGLLSPLGVIFGLFVAFLAAQVWSDVDRANVAVNREASALRGVMLLSRSFPTSADSQMRSLIARHIRDARDVEWPAMAKQRATLSMIPNSLAGALQLAIATPATTPGQIAAQHEIVNQLANALDARRQRILISRSEVNWVKWLALVLQAVCTLVAIAMVHSDNRPAAKLALGLFSTAIAVCVLLLAAHDRPFVGQLSIQPTSLLQVDPDSLLQGPGT